jgi:hypothetical protein
VILRALSVVLTAYAVSACAPASCFPEKARVASRLEGVPETIWGSRATLIELEPKRYCQVLFEPAFATHHAVWFTVEPSGDARVSVSVFVESTPEFSEAPLDGRTAVILERSCRRFLTNEEPKCARLGMDGVTFHAAHYVGESGYAMRSFWSPKTGTSDDKFVRLAEALRDYTVAPERLRSVYWWNIHRAVAELECALDSDRPGCATKSK